MNLNAVQAQPIPSWYFGVEKHCHKWVHWGLCIQTISLFVRIPIPWDQNIGKNSKMAFFLSF